jgi:hypothetical protein
MRKWKKMEEKKEEYIQKKQELQTLIDEQQQKLSEIA